MSNGDEKLRYDVEIDELSLSAQLERISQAINSTIANSSAQASMAPAMVTSASNYFGGIQSPLAPLDSGIPISPEFSMSQVFDDFSRSTQLGFQKFNSDYRTIGLTTPPPEHPDVLPFQRNFSVMGEPDTDFTSTTGAMLGLGRDPELITHSRYKRLAQKNASDALSE